MQAELNIGGQKVLVRGKVTDNSGKPLAGATLDVWQAADNGFYHMQDKDAPEFKAFWDKDAGKPIMPQDDEIVMAIRAA